jgi:hypothetical protein
MSEPDNDCVLSIVVCNRCDRVVDMDAEFGQLENGERLVCPCGSDEFSWRGKDDETGEVVDFVEAHLLRGRT